MVSLTSQLIALRRLKTVDQDLLLLGKRLNTGLKVADPADSTAVLAKSRVLSYRTSSLASVQGSLETGMATVSSAASAVTTAGGLLANVRSLLAAARSPDADLQSIQSQLSGLTGQLRSTVVNASFRGVNLLASSSAASGYAAAPRDSAGQIYSIGVDRNRTRLLDTLGTTGILQRTFDLPASGGSIAAPSALGLSGAATQAAGTASSTPTTNGLSGAASSVSGLAANPPAMTGLSGTATAVAGITGATPATSGLSGAATTVAGVAATAGGAAKAYIGTLDAAGFGKGDTVNVKVSLNGGAEKTVTLYQRNVSTAASLQTELQRAVDAEFGAGAITARVEADNRISLETVSSGAGRSIAVTGVSVTDGDNVTTSTLGLQTQTAYSTATTTINGGVHKYDSLESFNLSGLDKTDQLQFKVDYKEDGGYAFSYTINVKLATVTDGASLVSAINQKISDAGGFHSLITAAAWVGGNVLFYQKTEEGGIKVSQITAINGDGTLAANLGLTAGSGTNSSGTTATAASVTTGSDFSGPVTLGTGAALKFDLTVNGVTKTVSIDKATVEAALAGQAGYTAGSGTIADVSKLVLVAQRALTDQAISGVTVAASGNRLVFTKSGTPTSGDSINVSNVSPTSGTSTAASLTTGSDFTGPRTIAANASLDFTLTLDGTATNISVGKADVETALAGRAGYTSGSGTIANATEFALSVQAAMTRQGLTGVTVAASGSRLQFTKTAAGSGTIAISNVSPASTATKAVATSGSTFTGAITVADDAAITFDIALDGAPAQRVTITRSTVEAALADAAGRNVGTGIIATATELATVTQRALADAGVAGVTVGTSGNRLTFTRSAAGAGSVALSNIAAAASTATGASLVTGSDFSGPVTVDAGAEIRFDLTLDTNAPVSVVIAQSTVEAALAGISGRTAGTGVIATVAEFALVVQQAVTEANVSGVTATASGNRVKLAKAAAGAGQVVLGNVTASAGSAVAPSSTTIDSINLNGAGFAGLGAAERSSLLNAYITNVEAIAADVAHAGSHLDLVAKQLEIQSRHTTKLQTIDTGRFGGLVNADLDADGARRAALEARLALARQALGIINESRKNILNIF